MIARDHPHADARIMAGDDGSGTSDRRGSIKPTRPSKRRFRRLDSSASFALCSSATDPLARAITR